MKPTKIVCVGRNYADHAKELGNAVPNPLSEPPILFIKPPSSLIGLDEGITWKDGLGECHFECELSIQIGQTLKDADEVQARAAISGVTLGLDLTLRDLQNSLKKQGYPWERAKAFDGSCVLGDWLAPDFITDYKNASYTFKVNGETRQTGETSHMLFDVIGLIAHISHTFTLEKGDVVMTGTPAGVAALHAGDQLEMTLDTQLGAVSWKTFVR
ncbi:fumarylacetoacetate hydrolase family protein [Aquirhabdus parva]|uniref:Fumarylacetoacetate hydrolase family protein n=1 Tax=Aquirhabdus parva TaxID=2283318 RepID=A0A345P3V0_9GAMM|nr:fumarylacetoacetate hydrolase family protein [Aquirhabdus parva]AXI01959.1 fumarylacetoacetate hydrolase family protein [Aquirhabdus parva]